MRAAIVYDCLYPLSRGGGERVYRRIAEALVDEGYEVEYLTRDTWSPAPAPAAVYHVVPVWRGEIADLQGTRRPAAAVAFARGVARAMRTRARYDLVIASSLPVLTLLGAAWGVRGRRTTLVADWLEVWSLRKWVSYSGVVAGVLASVLQWIGARVTRRHTVNSRFTGERLRAVNPRIHPIELGLLDLASPADPVIAAEPPIALAVSRLIADKRLETLPDALAVARQQVPGLRLVIVGTGPEHDTIRAAATHAGVADAVDLLGSVSDDELDRLRRTATVFVHPSAREGFGLVVAEAAAVGVPSIVVAGPDNAAAELVVDGVNGFVADSERARDLGAAIVRAVDAGPALRASTVEWWTRERRTRSVPEALRRLLRNPGSSSSVD